MGNNFTLYNTKYCENGDIVFVNKEKMGVVVDSNKIITLLDGSLRRVDLLIFKNNDCYKVVERYNFEQCFENSVKIFEAVKYNYKFLPCVTREIMVKKAINFHKNNSNNFKNNKEFILQCLK